MKVRNKNALEPNVERVWERPSAQPPVHVCMFAIILQKVETDLHTQRNITKRYLHKCHVRIEIS